MLTKEKTKMSNFEMNNCDLFGTRRRCLLLIPFD